MNVPQRRTRPASTGRSFDSRAYQDGLRALYGAPRRHGPLTAALELRAAAERLAGLADDFAAGVFDGRALPVGVALLANLARTIAQTNPRKGAQGGTP